MNNQNPVKSVSIATFGGQMGYSISMKITKDSLYYDFNIAMDSTKRKHIEKPNIVYKLEDLINPDNIVRFSRVKDGESRQPVDGTDMEITIETDKDKYTVINAWDDEVWQKTNKKMQDIMYKEFVTE
ncbi:hypothetical protein LUD75_09330 [Epilithonimonas sp. JDS]|uniref:hypothetical protein n=1 Tax=Epilithonimonas sp. JDS TaxID=2902797 RepID=UPI001E2F10CB|nr:hypothetical protein [Epilithonimonas sp. JDS]MCD9854906.1 hypothetical protein [Epilithonimonas sp. JDS]